MGNGTQEKCVAYNFGNWSFRQLSYGLSLSLFLSHTHSLFLSLSPCRSRFLSLCLSVLHSVSLSLLHMYMCGREILKKVINFKPMRILYKLTFCWNSTFSDDKLFPKKFLFGQNGLKNYLLRTTYFLAKLAPMI